MITQIWRQEKMTECLKALRRDMEHNHPNVFFLTAAGVMLTMYLPLYVL